ncbi:MAG TPA: hypothetical protein VFD05_03675 [Bacilli bacterium]|nr:hypothetical protein [Bacilli bacterium]
MNITTYLETYQKTLHQTFVNAKNTNNVSHAYLLVGEEGTPLKEVAVHLAKTLLCDGNAPLACDNCLTCHRVDSGNYADFFIYDGSESSIKKEDVAEIEKTFSTTSVEAKGVLIYIVHLVERMTIEATNALLKFLEEPGKNIFAFLTTHNENIVLPTIKSRSQIVRLNLIKRAELLALLENSELTNIDKELLSSFYNLPLLIEEQSADENYIKLKDVLLDLLDEMATNLKNSYITASKLIPTLRDRYLYRRLFAYFSLIFKDVVNYRYKQPLLFPALSAQIEKLSAQIKDPLPLIIKTYEVNDKINANVTIDLLIDELFINLIKGSNHDS